MGAAGYVAVYEREAVERAYAELYPERNITEDWWYLDTITTELNGTRYVFDYYDDQGGHDGTGNCFWFSIEDADKTDGVLRSSIVFGSELSAAQKRCKEALQRAGLLTDVEVWT